MKYTQLGRTGAWVSRLCLGTMNFGAATEESDSFRIMDRALELDINFFDTADRYGQPAMTGATEQIVGRWFAQGDRRDRVVLATKFFGPMGAGANDGGNSAYHMRAACEASLKRLQTDRIDLYQMHHIDRGQPHRTQDLGFLGGDAANLRVPPHLVPGPSWEEIWQQYETLVGQGNVVYAGSSNFAAWNIAQANERASQRDFLGLVSEQSLYNLTQRTLELEMVPVCRAYGVGIIPWSPLGGGRLAGAVRGGDGGGRRSKLNLTAEQTAQLERYTALCDEIGEEPASVALAWLLANPVVTAPIIGPRTIEQLEGAVRATEIELDDETLGRLDEIFPGPGGEAPQAYAW